MNILLVDDEKDYCKDMSDFLSNFDHNIKETYDGMSALTLIKKDKIDLVISDIKMPGMSGIDLVKEIKKEGHQLDIILISGSGDILKSINAIDLGIVDFLVKPIDVFKLAGLISLVEDKKGLKKSKDVSADNITELNDKTLVEINKLKFGSDHSLSNPSIGKIGIFSEKMINIYKKLRKLQEFPEYPILLSGRTGTGKEVLAKYVHYENQKNEGPFIGINCSTINKNLFEAELFGYEKGSFTGADTKGRDGKIKLAEKGTLFLDEITEISQDLQVKLLRIIQEREYYKVGGNEKLPVNTRIICATNKDIKKLVSMGRFRKDLYFRLNVCQIKIPSLKERKEEIIPLFIMFIKQLNEEMKKKVVNIEAKALKVIREYKWPGNVRELENVITRVMLFSEEKTLKYDHFKFLKIINIEAKRSTRGIFDFELPETSFDLNDFVNEIVKKALKKFNGNKTKAAEYLRLTRIQMYRRFKV